MFIHSPIHFTVYLPHSTGSFVEEAAQNGSITITAPAGNIQIKMLMAMATVFVAGLWVIVLPLIARLPARKWIYWVLFGFGCALFPLLAIKGREALDPFLVLGLAHLPIVMIVAIGAAVAGEWFAERQLAKLEFM